MTPTTLRPDIVVWDDIRKRLLLVELTVCFETMFVDAAERKRAKYEELKQRAATAGYWTLEVWSRGIVNNNGLASLRSQIAMRERHLGLLLQSLSQEVVEQSYQIWYKRHKKP